MAQRRPRPPLTAREIAAWGAGRRCGASDDFPITGILADPPTVTEWLTPAELALMNATDLGDWWVWWWRGYCAGRAAAL